MTIEILMHIDERLNEQQKRDLLLYMGNRRDGLEARFRSTHPHLLFVAYEPRRTRPRELLNITSRAGYHARLVSF